MVRSQQHDQVCFIVLKELFTVIQPKQITEIKKFIEFARMKDARGLSPVTTLTTPMLMPVSFVSALCPLGI